jgi:hypothetical protein
MTPQDMPEHANCTVEDALHCAVEDNISLSFTVDMLPVHPRLHLLHDAQPLHSWHQHQVESMRTQQQQMLQDMKSGTVGEQVYIAM